MTRHKCISTCAIYSRQVHLPGDPCLPLRDQITWPRPLIFRLIMTTIKKFGKNFDKFEAFFSTYEEIHQLPKCKPGSGQADLCGGREGIIFHPTVKMLLNPGRNSITELRVLIHIVSQFLAFSYHTQTILHIRTS